MKAWTDAIKGCGPGAPYSVIGDRIEHSLKSTGFSVAKDFAGHGIGKLFHTTPTIFHYSNRARVGVMQPGHVFTIEPIVCAGRGGFDCSTTWSDGWTEVCKDGLPSAQYEHTLLITPDGVEELTGKLPTSPLYCH